MLRVGLMAIEIEGNKIALTRWLDEKKKKWNYGDFWKNRRDIKKWVE